MNQSPRTLIASRSGIARKAELLRAGATEHEIDTAWREGRIIRVRHGVYAKSDANAAIVRAARVGGALSGSSAAELYGIWTPHEFVLTVSVAANARRLRDPDHADQPLAPGSDDVLVLRDGHQLRSDERHLVSPTTVLVQAVGHLEPRLALATIDSALRLPVRWRPDLTEVRRRLPRRCHRLLDSADVRAESGTESVFRHGLLEAGVEFSAQQWLTDSIRVDFVVAGFLVVECTSRQHHSDPGKYNQDRERIRVVTALGYVVLEFTYVQVLFDWDGVWAAVLTALRLRASALPRPLPRNRE